MFVFTDGNCSSACVANDWAVRNGSESPRQVAVALVCLCFVHWWIVCFSRVKTACRARTGERSVGSLGSLIKVSKCSQFDVCLWCVSSTGRQRRSRSSWKRRQSNWFSFIPVYFPHFILRLLLTLHHHSPSLQLLNRLLLLPNTLRVSSSAPACFDVDFAVSLSLTCGSAVASNDSAETFRTFATSVTAIPWHFFAEEKQYF